MTTWGYRLATSLAGSVLAYILLVPLWIARFFGLIKIEHKEHLNAAARMGKLLIIANHPSLLETIVIPSLIWHYGWRDRRHQVWSVTDEHLFGNRPWLYQAFHCICVSREDTTQAKQRNRAAMLAVTRRLERNGIVVLYPEGGRTCKGSFVCVDGTRSVRSCSPLIVQLAQKRGAIILPLYVTHGTSDRPLTLGASYRKLFWGTPMVISVGQPLQRAHEVTDAHVVSGLLGAGRENNAVV